MAKTEKTVGSGITARKVVSYSGPDMWPAFRRMAEHWNAELAEAGGSDFGANTLRVIRWARGVLERAGGKRGDVDSAEDFARRILRYHDLTLAAIERGDADSAADLAYDLGVIAATAGLKFSWVEQAARKGEALRLNGKRGAEKRHGEERARWPAMAHRYAELRAEGRLEKEAAGIAATEFDVTPGTIRRAAGRTS